MMRTLAQRYEELLRARFPSVSVVESDRNDEELRDVPQFEVLNIPEERLREFVEFRLDELPDLAERDGLAVSVLHLHTIADTAEITSWIATDVVAAFEVSWAWTEWMIAAEVPSLTSPVARAA